MEQKNTIITGDILKEIAIILWQKLFQYVGQEMSKFSTRQLEHFKTKQYIKKYKQHREAKAINLVAIEKKLQEIRKIVGLYKNEDIYYMNKSILFWKMISDRTLGTKQSIKEKHNKVLITINLAYNADKSHKLEL